MLIIDAHQDIAFNAIAFGRDYTASVAETRRREGPRDDDIATVGLPDALDGGVGLVFGTLYVAPESGRHLTPGRYYRTAEEAYQQAHEQLAVYQALAQRGAIQLVRSRRDLDALLAQRASGVRAQGVVVLMEGADPIRTPAEVSEWRELGVRIVGPAWKATRYCGGTGDPGPLTPAGVELLREMSRAGLALDLSHMAEESFWQSLELFDGPLLASHSNCRALVAGPREDRHLSDAMITALVERGGVIGVVLYNRFLDSAWSSQRGKQAVGLEAVVRHIDHICQVVGDARHVAIGSDFDGGFGREAIPSELDSVADLPRIGAALRAHGYSDADVAAIMGGNWLRKLTELLPA